MQSTKMACVYVLSGPGILLMITAVQTSRRRKSMDPGEQTTGTRDEQYNLVSVLYHALHEAETVEAYILDAEAAGDERLLDL